MGLKMLCGIFGMTILSVQSNVLKNPDVLHSRFARSPCDSCQELERDHRPAPPPPELALQPPLLKAPHPPPPPPPVFRTQNWSGYARSHDGSQQGVFSGAAAAADTPRYGQAYSLAASSAGVGSNNQQSWPQGSSYQGSNQVGYSSNGQSNNDRDNTKYNSQQHVTSYDADKSDQFKGSSSYQSRDQHHELGSNYHDNSRADNSEGFGQSKDPAFYGRGDQEFRQDSWRNQKHDSDSIQSTVDGAFNLAAQGLQAAQAQDNENCATCSKGNYALSNARSESGSAVAVSVGG